MELNKILTPKQTIAIVGLSDKPERPSYQVAEYLLERGYIIIPVNPLITEVFGLKTYPSISAIPQRIHIDIVDIFRKSEEVSGIVAEIIANGRKPAIWMQEGITSFEAKKLAESNGMSVVMDMCIMKAHRAKELVE